MFWTLLALLLLVVTGGFISYFGDLQGRRWGKKRVSWFGLRPKHTAILITSLTGGVIAFLSVAVLMLVVPNVRDLVLHGEIAIRDSRRRVKELSRQLDIVSVKEKQLSGQVGVAEAARNEINKELARATAENEQAQRKNAAMQKGNDRLVNVNMDLQRRKFALESSYRSLEEKINQSKAKLAEVETQRANAENINKAISRQNTELGRQNSELERERATLVQANTDLKNAKQALLADNTELKQRNSDLTKLNSQLQGGVSALERAYAGLLNGNESMEDKNKQLQAQLKERQGELDELSHQRDELYQQLAGSNRTFVQTYLALRQARFNLRADTELARRTVDAHLSPKAVKEELMALLKDASDRARQFGAVNGENGRAVCIVPKRLVTPASVQMADESASLNAIVDAIAASNTPVVVVARAINNSIADEQVLVEVSSYTSVNVFKKGEVVASRPIDARQPLDRLVQSVVSFLKEDVRSAAIKAGTIPQISPETGEEEVGIIDTPQMVDLVDRIRRLGGKVRLNAVANASLTSADLLTFGESQVGKPLNLRFELRRQSDRDSRKSEIGAN